MNKIKIKEKNIEKIIKIRLINKENNLENKIKKD